MTRSLLPAGPGKRPAWWLGAALLIGACSGPPTGEPTALPSVGSTTAPSTTAVATSSSSTTSFTIAPVPPTTAPVPETTPPPAGEPTVHITIVYDNYVHDPRFTDGWGFAALVEVGGHKILFDTGADGEALLGNLALLDVDPLALDALVLSHEHRDHTGGLAALLATGAKPTVYLPASFSPTLKGRVASHTEVVEITGPREILPGVFSTGEMGAVIIEQALVVATPEGSVLITGCAHPGIVEMVQQGREAVAGEVALVVGGFHLVQAAPQTITSIVAAFRDSGVRQVAPTHCSGDAARDAFAREYGDDFLEAGVGRVIETG